MATRLLCSARMSGTIQRPSPLTNLSSPQPSAAGQPSKRIQSPLVATLNVRPRLDRVDPDARQDRGSSAAAPRPAPRAPSSAAALATWLGAALSRPGQAARTAVLAGAVAGFALGTGAPARADYVSFQPGQAATLVQSELSPTVLPRAAAAAESEFNPSALSQYGFFNLFWNSSVEGTSQQGVWSVSPEGVSALLDYAKRHNLDGAPLSPAESGPATAVSEGHRALVEYLLHHEYYSAFISQEAVPLLRAAFALPAAEVQPSTSHQPTDVGEFLGCVTAEWWGSQGIDGWAIRGLPEAMTTEYQLGSQAGRYDSAASTTETKAFELGCLLNQFARALNRWDDLALPTEDQQRHKIQERMLDHFFALPAFDPALHGETAHELRRYFASDFNGSGMGLAQTIVKGFDANEFPTDFPNASGRGSPVRLSMSKGNLTEAMVALDEWRVAAGLEPRAVERKNRSAMGYIVGEESGHDKVGLTERTALASGVNFGRLIEFGSASDGFRKLSELASGRIKPAKGFDFPIDAITANGQAVAASGASIEVRHQRTNERLAVELVLHEADGQPTTWSAKFTDGSGAEVSPGEVVGLIKRGGRILGDGRANQTLDTGYWGMCDDNTGADIIFGRYANLPATLSGQADGKVYVRAGDTLMGIDAQQALELVLMDLPGIGRTEWPSNAGYRFGYDSSTIRWRQGNVVHTNTGRLTTYNPSPFTQNHHEWITSDILRIDNRPEAPILGSIRFADGEGIDAKDVVGVARTGAETYEVFYRQSGYVKSKEGKLETELGIDWSRAGLGTSDRPNEPGAHVRLSVGQTLEQLYESRVAPTGVSFEQFREANEALFARPASELSSRDEVVIPQLYVANDPAKPFRGDFHMLRDDGVEIVVPAQAVDYIQGETPYDLPFTHYLRFVQMSEGVYGTDAAMSRGISNGRRWVEDIVLHETRGADRPSWAGKEALVGRGGPLHRVPGDKLVFAAGQSGSTTVFAGWYQVDQASGRVLNEGFISGHADFAWGTVNQGLDWFSKSTYIGDAMNPELRLQLLINGMPELRQQGENADAIAKSIDLPSDWRRYIVGDDEVQTFISSTADRG